MKVFKTLREHWKKSIFFSLVGAYGISWGDKRYRDYLLRKEFCKEASKYGLESSNKAGPKKILVFLNPAAHSGKAKNLYEKNVAPILHCAGLQVNVVRTEYQGQGKKYAKLIESDYADGIVIAGGNGTVTEIVTGLLLSSKFNIPVGVVPLGKTNSLAKKLFGEKDEVLSCMESAMAVVQGVTKKINVMRVEADKDKIIYAVSNLVCGAFRDAHANSEKFWYLGPLKRKWTYIQAVLSGEWPKKLDANVFYTNPCTGCNKCEELPTKQEWSWKNFIIKPTYAKFPEVDYSNVVNESCGMERMEYLSTLEFQVKISEKDPNILEFKVITEGNSKTLFIREGWSREKNKNDELLERRLIDVNSLKLQPNLIKDKKSWLNIDNEEFELLPFTINLLKSKLPVFIKESNFDTSSIKTPLKKIKEKLLRIVA